MTDSGQSVTKPDTRALAALCRVDARFGGEGPGRWTFDGEPLRDEIADVLLSLHDHLNDLGDEFGVGP